MTNQRWFAALCGLLIIGALAVTLFNTSAFALYFEPNAALSWAWAVYVDIALAGYTIAHVWLRLRGQRTGVVRFGFYWFVALSLIANVTVVLTRYDDRRGAALIDALLASDAFLWGACIVYGASIPVSVLTFAHTIADSVSVRDDAGYTYNLDDGGWEETRPGAATKVVRNIPRGKCDVVAAARRAQPDASKRDIMAATGLCYSTVRKWWEAT
jgi:hypothetical protein